MDILICDDDVGLAGLIAEGLRINRHTVVVVASAKAALEAFETLNFDAALLDLDMPDMDGWTLATWLRRRLTGLNVRLIALSARSSDEDIVHSARAGFDRHLCKPSGLATIEAALDVPVATGFFLQSRASHA